MARASVRSTIADESAVIPAQEGPSSLIAGILDPDGYPNNLLGSLGFTHEREQGYMTISSVGEWHERLKTNQPTGIGPYDLLISYSDTQSFEAIPFIHLSGGEYIGGDIFSGGTFERWPAGPIYQRWNYIWNIIENYLQYGGQITIFGANSSIQSKADVVEVAKNKKIPLDVFISPFFLENNDVRNIVEYRQDCIAITSVPSENKAGIIERPKNEPQGPSDPPASSSFLRGDTYSLYEYDPTPAGFAEPEFDRAFLGNTGNTYRYEPGRLVYSVVVRDDRPKQEYLGSTTDVVNWDRYRSVYENETFSHYRGWTLDILGNSDCIALGATFSGGTNDSAPNGGVVWYNPNAGTKHSVVGIQQETINSFPTEFTNWQNHKKNNIRFYANPQFKTKMGEAIVAWKCLNLEDNGVGNFLMDVAPTIISYTPNLVGPQFTYQTFYHIAVPSNWMDPYSYKIQAIGAVLTEGIAKKDARQGISAFSFYAGGGGSRSWELLPDPNDPGKTIRTGFPSADFRENASLSWSETRSSAMIDLRKSFDPNFDFLDNLLGPSGLDPNPELYDLTQQARSLDIVGFASPVVNGATYGPQVLSLKRNFNIFDSIQGPTTEADTNGNTPSDFWGCTCSRIPEYLKTFNLVGVTPDICIEVGPNSRTQDVTADGSTYSAYVAWSHPVPYVGIKSLVNIFGETIGAARSAGSTLSNFMTKYESISTQTLTCSDSYGNTEQTQVKSIVFYPLIQNTSFDEENPIGPGNYPLKRDEENYFSIPVFPLDQAFDDKSYVAPSHSNAPHQDSNHALYETHFQSNLSEYEDTGYHETVVMFNRMVNNTEFGGFRGFIGATLASPSPINEVGNVGASYAELFYLGYSGGSTLYGQGLSFDGYDGIYLVAEVDVVSGVPSFGFDPLDYDLDVTDYTYNNIFSSNADLYEFPVFGEKYAEDSYEAYKSVEETQDINRGNEIPFTSDVAGMFARLFRDLSPWFSPANQRVSDVTDIIAERYHLSNAEQDDLYDNKINFIKQIDGALKLWGDKTFADSTSTFSRVNVANLFIYLKKKIEPLGRRFLFEQNDAQSRELFRNAVEPFLQTLRGQRAITDFKVICDETNNTPDIVDSNQFVAEILIKPTKTINYIRLTMTNVGTSFELE